MRHRFLFLTVAALALVLAGCGGTAPAEVSGTVSYQGRAVANGYITFFPVDSPGNACGAEIVNGKFSLADMPPGKKRVLITSHPTVTLDKGSTEAKPKVKVSGEPVIPPSIPGNNRVIEVAPGKQTFEFKL